jgi:hypothetical protein
MRRALFGLVAVLAALLVAAPVSAASATSWRATIVGTTLQGGATTIIQSDGHGSINVTLHGVTPGQKVAVLVNPLPCPEEAQQILSFDLPAASASGVASGRHTLTAAEVTAYNQALSRRTKISILVVDANDKGCGDQDGSPAVGTARIKGTVAAVGATYDIRYPVVSGLATDAAAAAINHVLHHDADGGIASFSSEAIQAGKPMRDFSPSDAEQTFSVSLSQSNLLSVGVLFSWFFTSAAHPGAALSTYTFDTRTGALLKLSDLFRPGASYLPLLSSESRTRLRALFHDPTLDSFIDGGTTPSASNFTAWQLVPSGLKITFQEYQAVPYAFGMPSIVIPWSDLRSVLNFKSAAAAIVPAGPCQGSQLAATMSDWQAGAGQRGNFVHFRNVSASTCWLQGQAQAQLLDARGRVLLQSGPATVSSNDPRVTLAPGANASNLIYASNYCGPAPANPTHLQFRLPSNGGTVSATPSSGGSTGDDLPPCFGPTAGGYLLPAGWHTAP